MSKLLKTFTTKGLLACWIAFSLIFVSCDEKTPFPLSSASFEVSTAGPEIYNPVKFENLSKNAVSYQWDFGDGSTGSTDIAPTHTYTESGEFIVSLIAFTEDDQKSTETRVINIGKRYLTGMYLTNINLLDANGNPWDNDGTGPDVLMQIGPSDFETEEEFEGFFFEDIEPTDYNTAFGISTDNLLREDYLLNNEEFFILLEEVDTVNNEAVFTTMIELRFNPVVVDGESITEVKRRNPGGSGGTGDLTIPFVVVNEYQFFLEFEIR
jgi:PKD repeat protein